MHPDCSASTNRVEVVQVDGTSVNGWHIPNTRIFEKDSILNLEDFCKEQFGNCCWCLHTCSYFVRKDTFDWYKKQCQTLWKNMPYGDMPLILSCFLNGNVFFIAEVYGRYRWLSGGYTSMIFSNPRKAISDNENYIEALRVFDNYTQNNYHNYIERRIWKSNSTITACYLEISPLRLLNPKYWKYPMGRKKIPLRIAKYCIKKFKHILQ